jgi:hypothetical protein
MKCAVHPDAEATAYCRNCGKALCPECTRSVQGMHYCEPCLAALVSRPPAAQPSHQHSPAAAFFLGLIPGLGAVYNGEYTKALVHVAIFVGLVSLDSTGMHQPMFGLLTGFFCLYMPVEACVTATNMQRAEAQAAAPIPASHRLRHRHPRALSRRPNRARLRNPRCPCRPCLPRRHVYGNRTSSGQ